MSEKKILNDEELNQVAGGYYYKTLGELTFEYEKGYETEICDYEWSGLLATHRYTHRARIIKRGYFINSQGFYETCYYFQGIPNPEPDVDGWYSGFDVCGLEDHNYTNMPEKRNCGDAKITEVDWYLCHRIVTVTSYNINLVR